MADNQPLCLFEGEVRHGLRPHVGKTGKVMLVVDILEGSKIREDLQDFFGADLAETELFVQGADLALLQGEVLLNEWQGLFAVDRIQRLRTFWQPGKHYIMLSGQRAEEADKLLVEQRHVAATDKGAGLGDCPQGGMGPQFW